MNEKKFERKFKREVKKEYIKQNKPKWEKEKANLKAQVWKEQTKKGYENKGILNKILIGIVLLIVLINYIKVATGNNITMGLQTFIQALQTISNTYISLPNLQNLTIIADWGVFDFLKNAINTIISIFNVALFIANTLLNLIIGVMATIRNLIF